MQKYNMQKYKMIISYDGTHYHGWQIQPHKKTIQEILQYCLKIILKKPVQIIGSSRTDKGVHAIGQVAHFLTDQELNIKKFMYSLNSILPKDIKIKKIEQAHRDFHARYSAVSKKYDYYIGLSNEKDPFFYLYKTYIPFSLNVEEMKRVSKCLIGKHDFTSFVNSSYPKKNPIKTIFLLNITKQFNDIKIEIQADGFLYKMVRNIVGALMEAGKGKISLVEMNTILKEKNRQKAPYSAAASGLFLSKIYYPKNGKAKKIIKLL